MDVWDEERQDKTEENKENEMGLGIQNVIVGGPCCGSGLLAMLGVEGGWSAVPHR